jgi:nucleotide-binding universal stress UspA family protein
MQIALCLDYSSSAKQVLVAMQTFIKEIRNPEITVIHIINLALFNGGTGFEPQLDEDLEKDSSELKTLAMQFLGEDIRYIEDHGIPRQKIDELLARIDYDLLVIGNHSKNLLGNPRLGMVATHLLLNSTKPVLIIP